MKQLEKILNSSQNDLKSVYLLYGEEEYLLDGFKKKFMKKFAKNSSGFNFNILNEDEDFAEKLVKQTNTLPVMAEKRFIIAKCKDFFRKKTAKDELIIDLLNDFPSTTILLILVPGKVDRRIKPVMTLKNAGEVINVKPPRNQQLDRWIINEFTKRGKKVSSSGVQLLKQMFNNELQRLESEINKITTYKYEDEEISLTHIKEIISKDRLLKENVIFDFIDALSENKKGKALYLLNEMIQAGESPLMILAMITRQLRLLLSVKVLKTSGKNPGEIAKILGEHPYPIKKSYQQGNNFTEEELELMMERFLQSNLEIVTGQYNDNKLALEIALLR